MKDVFFKVLENSQRRSSRRIEEQKQILEVEILALDRNEKIAKRLRGIGFTDEEIRKILQYEPDNIDTIVDLVAEQKITGLPDWE